MLRDIDEHLKSAIYVLFIVLIMQGAKASSPTLLHTITSMTACFFLGSMFMQIFGIIGVLKSNDVDGEFRNEALYDGQYYVHPITSFFVLVQVFVFEQAGMFVLPVIGVIVIYMQVWLAVVIVNVRKRKN